MSQVIQKFQPGGKTTQPTLYARGNEQVDLDAVTNQATIELHRQLSNSRLKDKEKEKVIQAFGDIIQGMYDKTFTYKIGGGYNNTVGMTNSEKGFDPAGLAAGVIGSVLRSQAAYVAPEEKPDPSKIAWKNNSSIGIAANRYMFGSDDFDLNSFIGLDWNPTSNKVEGTKARATLFKEALEYVAKNFNSLFTSFTDSDREVALRDINKAIEKLSDFDVTQNEYLDLHRATGFRDLGNWFGIPTPAGNAGTTPGNVHNGVTYTDEAAWRAAKYPRTTERLNFNRSLSYTTLYRKEDRDKLAKALASLDKDQLLKLIATGMTFGAKSYELNKIPTIIEAFGGAPNFENNIIMKGALELCRRRGFLRQFKNNGNLYYIPFNSEKLNSRNVGIVYEIDSTGNHRLIEMDRNDIEPILEQWHNEFTGVPSHKEGGVIRKFQPGGKWYSNFSNFDENNYIANYNLEKFVNPDDFGDAWVSPSLSKYDSGRYAASVGNNREHMKDIQGRKYFTNYTSDLFNEDGTLNELGMAFAQQSDARIPKNSDGTLSPATILDENGNVRKSWTTKVKDTYRRQTQQTFNNVKDYITHNRADEIQGPKGNIHLKEGNKYFYKDEEGNVHWVNPDEVEGYETEFDRSGLDDNKTFWNYYRITGPKSAAPVTNTNATGDGTGDGTGDQGSDGKGAEAVSNLYKLFEKYFPSNSSTGTKANIFQTFMQDLIPEGIGIGRLFDSLRTNRNVYKTLLPSIKPVLKNTYERYSPVTGAFSAMQLKNRQAADVLSQAQNPFTSDASLAAARMLEGQRQANQLQSEGFLTDDQEIKRTKAEALARQEDNMVRRSDVANFNRASINQTNKDRAQLKSTLLKSNWQSRDNYFAELEGRLRNRFAENRERMNNLYDRLISSQAEQWYNKTVADADRHFNTWYNNPDNEGKDPSTEYTDWDKYVAFKQRAREMANAMIYADTSRRYDLGYKTPYTPGHYNLFTWDRRHLLDL